MITRTVLAVDLKDDPAAIETYGSITADVWPEVSPASGRSGIRDMDIYLLGRRLVMVLETDGPDFRRCFAAHVVSIRGWPSGKRSCDRCRSRRLPMPRPATGGRRWSRLQPRAGRRRSLRLRSRRVGADGFVR